MRSEKKSHLGLYNITDKQLGDVKRRLGELAKIPAPHVLAARNREVLDSLKDHIAAALEQGYGEGVIHEIFVSQGIDVSASVIRNYICQMKHGRSYSTWSGSDARKRAAKNAQKKNTKTEHSVPFETPKPEEKTDIRPELKGTKTEAVEKPAEKPSENLSPDRTSFPAAEPVLSAPKGRETVPPIEAPAGPAAEPAGTEVLKFSDGFKPIKVDAGPIRFSGSPVVYEFLSGSVRQMGVYDCPIAGTSGSRSWSFRTTEGVTFRVFEQDLRDGTCRAAKKDLRRC